MRELAVATNSNSRTGLSSSAKPRVVNRQSMLHPSVLVLDLLQIISSLVFDQQSVAVKITKVEIMYFLNSL